MSLLKIITTSKCHGSEDSSARDAVEGRYSPCCLKNLTIISENWRCRESGFRMFILDAFPLVFFCDSRCSWTHTHNTEDQSAGSDIVHCWPKIQEEWRQPLKDMRDMIPHPWTQTHSLQEDNTRLEKHILSFEFNYVQQLKHHGNKNI